MKITVITMFPGFFDSPLETSLVGRSQADGLVEVEVVDLRPYGLGPHHQLDDSPFGGGAGLVMMVEPLDAALTDQAGSHKVLFSAAGTPLTQETLDRFAGVERLTLVCGRYEGVDGRVAEHLVDEEVSIGDFVMLGGEVAALAVIEGVVRLLPGTVGNPDSLVHESYRDGLLEEPHFTRPARYKGWEVPEVLLSGDHGRVAKWRDQQRAQRTRERRPDLWKEVAEDPDTQ